MARDEIFVTTQSVEPGLRLDFGRETTKFLHEPVLQDDDKATKTSFDASIRLRSFGSLLLLSTTYMGHLRRRSRQMVLKSDTDFCIIHLVKSGHHIGDFDDTEMRAGAGDLYITDMSRPFTSQVEKGGVDGLVVARKTLEKSIGGQNLHGLVLPAERPMARLIADCLQSVTVVAGDLPDVHVPEAEDALLTLIGAGFRGEQVGWSVRTLGRSAIFRQAVLDFIDGHLRDPRLDPNLLARHFRVSRTHLYRAFEADGGIAGVIRERRLNLAYQKLLDHREAAMSVKKVAYDCGFTSSSQFVRAFHVYFGVTPGKVQGRSAPFVRIGADLSHLQCHFASLDSWTREKRSSEVSSAFPGDDREG